jgi:hypothetical protein
VDKAAAKKTKAETKPKKAADRKRKNPLDDIIAEAKNAFGDISTTGERKLRKRPESARPAATSKKAAPKKKAPKAAKKTADEVAAAGSA